LIGAIKTNWLLYPNGKKTSATPPPAPPVISTFGKEVIFRFQKRYFGFMGFMVESGQGFACSPSFASLGNNEE